MAKITFNNKDKNGAAPLNQFRDVDANEIKTSVNAAYDELDNKVATADFNPNPYTGFPDPATITDGQVILVRP